MGKSYFYQTRQQKDLSPLPNQIPTKRAHADEIRGSKGRYFQFSQLLRVCVQHRADVLPVLQFLYFLLWPCRTNANTTRRMRIRLESAITSRNHHSS